jgi:hypothetical protein
MIQSSILDPIHPSLPEIWDDPDADQPNLKPRYAHFITKHIYDTLERHGYADPIKWAKLYISGSLTTLQYSPESDVDVNLFVDSEKLPEWSRAEMIGIMVNELDGVPLSGTQYLLQVYVMPSDVKPADKYQSHIRSGYSIDDHRWIEPPDRKRIMNIEKEENAWYVAGLEAADKMESLLKYEPDKAMMYYEQIHKRRQRDDTKGDFGPANIAYKVLERSGLIDKIHQLMSTHTAAFGRTHQEYLPEQLDYLKNDTRRFDEQNIPILRDRPSGTRMWRVEDRPYGVSDKDISVGRHWTTNPLNTDRYLKGYPNRIIWQGTLTDPNHAYDHGHQTYMLDPNWGGEHEVRMRNGAPVQMEGYWRHTDKIPLDDPWHRGPESTAENRFWPIPNWPENPDDRQALTGFSSPGGKWEFVPHNKVMQVGDGNLAKYKTPEVDEMWKAATGDAVNITGINRQSYNR